METHRKGLEKLSKELKKGEELSDPKRTSEERITRVLNYVSDSDESIHRKIAALRNPNVTSEHIKIALNGNSADVVLAAIESPVATKMQIQRGIRILDTRFSVGRAEVVKMLSDNIRLCERLNQKEDAENIRRVLEFLAPKQ
jgi:hypothetical protein